MARFKSATFTDMKRRALLDAALAVFSDKGLDGASMRAIAAEAGVTTGALYSLFEGKEDIYAELLGESLARLHAFVKERAAAAETPREVLRAAIRAFYDYYAARLFEIELGMHSFAGLKPSSLGRDRDADLNAALIATLDIFADAVARTAPELSAAQVRTERDAIFAALIGTLVLASTGRDESVGTTADAVITSHIDALLQRL